MKKILMFAIPGLLVIGCLVFFARTAQSHGFGGHGSGMMGEFMIFRLEHMAKDLNLTPDQQAKLDTIKQGMSANWSTGMQKRQATHDTIQQELQKDNPDFSGVIAPLLDAQIDARAQNAHQMVQQFSDFFNSLTADQKKTLATQALQHHHGFSSKPSTSSGQTNPGE